MKGPLSFREWFWDGCQKSAMPYEAEADIYFSRSVGKDMPATATLLVVWTLLYACITQPSVRCRTEFVGIFLSAQPVTTGDENGFELTVRQRTLSVQFEAVAPKP